MKTLIIVNLPKADELLLFQKEFADVLKKDDVILIENPENKNNLAIQLESYQGQFDRVVVSTHGGVANSTISTMGVFKEEYIPITDVIKILNKGNEATLEKIHLTSCFIGFNFDKLKRADSSLAESSEFIEKLDLEKLLLDNQMLYLHGDAYQGTIIDSLGQRLKGIAANKDYRIKDMILDSAESLQVAKKADGQLKTYFHYAFGQSLQRFSTESLKSYLISEIERTKDIEDSSEEVLNIRPLAKRFHKFSKL